MGFRWTVEPTLWLFITIYRVSCISLVFFYHGNSIASFSSIIALPNIVFIHPLTLSHLLHLHILAPPPMIHPFLFTFSSTAATHTHNNAILEYIIMNTYIRFSDCEAYTLNRPALLFANLRKIFISPAPITNLKSLIGDFKVPTWRWDVETSVVCRYRCC